MPRRLTSGVQLAAGLLLLVGGITGCGGASSLPGAEAPASQSTTPTAHASHRAGHPPRTYSPLHRAVEDYLHLLATGDYTEAHRHLSARCRSALTIRQFRRGMGTAGFNAPSIKVVTSLKNAHHGVVGYILLPTHASGLPEQWIKHRGHWRDDGCRPG